MLSIFQHFVLFNHFHLFKIFLNFQTRQCFVPGLPILLFFHFFKFQRHVCHNLEQYCITKRYFSKVIGIFSILRRGFSRFGAFVAKRLRILMHLYIPTGPHDLSSRGIFHARRLIFPLRTLRWLLIRE